MKEKSKETAMADKIDALRLVTLSNGILSETAGSMGSGRRFNLAAALIQLEGKGAIEVTHYQDKTGKDRFRENFTKEGVERLKELDGRQKVKRLARTAAIETLFGKLSPEDKVEFKSVAALRGEIEKKIDGVNTSLDRSVIDRAGKSSVTCLITRKKASGATSESWSAHFKERELS